MGDLRKRNLLAKTGRTAGATRYRGEEFCVSTIYSFFVGKNKYFPIQIVFCRFSVTLGTMVVHLDLSSRKDVLSNYKKWTSRCQSQLGGHPTETKLPRDPMSGDQRTASKAWPLYSA